MTVNDTLPAGLSALINNPGVGAGPVAASGPGWTCTGTRCTRADVLGAGSGVPADHGHRRASRATRPPRVTNTATVAGGGDAGGGSASDPIAVIADACPNGWPAGPQNPEGANGCTALDAGDGCTTRIALTFDDGPSYYRPATLAHLRAKGVPATFFDTGMRLEANPQMVRAELAEGHTVLGHSYDHPNLGSIPAATLNFEIAQTAARFDALGAPYTFKVIRPPFLSVNAATQAAMAAMGFTVTPNPISATDWDPSRSAAQISAGIVGALRPGVAILLHDGPVDSPAGQATVDSVPLIIDAARARGYCFGTVDAAGQVVANKLAPSTTPFPAITGTVPYLPLAYAGTPPAPWALVPQPLRIAAAHTPSVFVRGETGSIVADRLQPDRRRHRRLDHHRHAGDPRRARRRPARAAPGGRARAPRRSPARATTCSRRGPRSRRSRSACAWRRRRRAVLDHGAARDRPQRQRLDRQRERPDQHRPPACPGTSGRPCPPRWG